MMTSQSDIKMKNELSKYAFMAKSWVAAGLNDAVGMYMLFWKFAILSVFKGEHFILQNSTNTKSYIFNSY